MKLLTIPTNKILSYEDYIQNKVLLNKYKLPELKTINKQYNLNITGTKKVLIKRIEDYFFRNKNAIKIQKCFRKYINHLFVILRGPSVFKRSLCVNETDGYTLEPLDEIPFEKFYSYIDKKNFIYGFDIFSLLQIYKKNGKIINPYTRERFDNKIINEIICLGKIIHILQPELFEDEKKQSDIIQNPQNVSFIRNRYLNVNSYNEYQVSLINKLQEIRNRSVQTRINDLFVEIDLLGNYTQSIWFSQLQKNDYIRFFRLLHNFWNVRGQLSIETKNNICQLFDPFLNLRISQSIFDLPINQIQETCLHVMEDMIYCGIDNEYRKLGALHVLSILTIVSIPARNNMIWLYESLNY